MTEEKRKTRSIELQIEIDASPEEVWKALTEAEGLASWFPLEARAEPGKGGKVRLSWGSKDMEWETTIDAWEPSRHLRWRDTGTELAVDYFIEGRGGKTVVRLVHSGFDASADWDSQYDGTESGWNYFLRNLKHYLERHRGERREMVWARPKTDAAGLDVWGKIFSDQGLASVSDPRSLAPGGKLLLGFGRVKDLEAQVRMARIPAAFSALVPGLNDALLFVELEGGGHCGFWLSTYGIPRSEVERLQSQLNEMVGALFNDAVRTGGAA